MLQQNGDWDGTFKSDERESKSTTMDEKANVELSTPVPHTDSKAHKTKSSIFNTPNKRSSTYLDTTGTPKSDF